MPWRCCADRWANKKWAIFEQPSALTRWMRIECVSIFCSVESSEHTWSLCELKGQRVCERGWGGGLTESNLCCAPELCSLLVYPGRRAESWTPGHATLLHSRHSSCSVCLESLQALRGSVPSKSPSVICNEICLCARRRQWGQIIQLHN